ncbi:hypothetical protein BDP81DRAFT_97785 [Colletotrichum phormii]|uniref:Uncharacterized protein n=1 Tax=Colletotrichum phormii TaxID=359342 RepID=A0AAJ0EBV6_9PEZI|nr:uncharacterized protein BDP81DRAFT_97785 [Colletotrichum phormii]KAK1625515.1 hypothetical protein BDP81DRAFT_97785 [Colletotrichum phormii]
MLRAHIRYFKPGLISPTPASSLISFLHLPPEACPTRFAPLHCAARIPLVRAPSKF